MVIASALAKTERALITHPNARLRQLGSYNVCCVYLLALSKQVAAIPEEGNASSYR
jgi:hypothetical protein